MINRFGCAGFESQDKAKADAPFRQKQSLNGEAKILQSWQKDVFPIIFETI